MNMFSFYLGNTISKEVNDCDIYQARTEFDVKIDSENVVTISKDEYFKIEDAPENIKPHLRAMVKYNMAVKYDLPEVVEVVVLDEIQELELNIEKVTDISAEELLDRVLEDSAGSDSALTIPDMLDGKISKSSSVVRQAIEVVNELKEQKAEKSKLELFKEKNKKKKSNPRLDILRRKRNARRSETE